MTTETDWVEKIGEPAYASLAEMVAALNCDYDRLEELRDDVSNYEQTSQTLSQREEWAEANPEDAEELKELEEAAGECKDQDEARERIEEDALSVEVRSGWKTPGSDLTPAEYCLLLGTGGPAVRIVGDLNQHNEPTSARLEVQDWFKPWTEYVPADEDVLLTYARCFFYGE